MIYSPRVSIHAPVRGATYTEDDKLRMKAVSIHAPVRGATAAGDNNDLTTTEFQSTRPCGARRPTQEM